MISTDLINRLTQAEFQITSNYPLGDIPDDLHPNLITSDGLLIEALSQDNETLDGLFEAVGKITTLKQFISNHQLMGKYSVALALILKQFKALQKEIRQILHQEVPLMIL